MNDPRLEKLVSLLTEYSTGIRKGDWVVVEAEDVCTPWIQETVKAAVEKGAYVETEITNLAVEEIILKSSSDEQLAHGHPTKEFYMEKIDVWLTAWGTANVKNLSNLPSQKIRQSILGKKKWRQAYLQRINSGSLKWCGCQVPTHADAQEAGMSLSEYEDFVYNACLLDKPDPAAAWRELSAWQRKWKTYLDSKSVFRFVSEDTDITVRTDKRGWENCDGKMNMPDGELCASPVEDSMEGLIRFTYPGIYQGKEIEDIRLEIKKGKVISASASRGEELLQELLKTDEDACRFGEIAIGTNYGIQKFTKNMLFDEKIGGTVHFAIGGSVTPEGKNESSIHWDMLCAMQKGGKIYADGQLFYENGQFMKGIAV